MCALLIGLAAVVSTAVSVRQTQEQTSWLCKADDDPGAMEMRVGMRVRRLYLMRLRRPLTVKAPEAVCSQGLQVLGGGGLEQSRQGCVHPAWQ